MPLYTAITGVKSSKSFYIVYQSDSFIVIMSPRFPYYMDYMKHIYVKETWEWGRVQNSVQTLFP
jgi:hypothetical protein